jgi:capsular exopolysaccharide synthesis family protein
MREALSASKKTIAVRPPSDFVLKRPAHGMSDDSHPSRSGPAPTGTELSVAGVVSVFKAVRKHWPMVVAGLVVGGGSGLLYAKSSQRIYEGSSLIEIDPRAMQPMGEGQNGLNLGSTLFWDATGYYNTQYRVITSVPVMKAAVEATSLQTDADFLGFRGSGRPQVTVEEAAAVLAGRVTVDPIKASQLVNIRVQDTDPKRAKRICDAVASAYVARNLQTAIDSSTDAVVWLEGQIDHLKGNLERDENALHDFKEQNNLPSLSINDTSNMLRLEMEAFDKALTTTRTQKAEIAARQAELIKVTPDDPDAIPSSELLSNSYLQSLRAQYRSLLQQRGALIAQGRGENHPAVKEATDRLREAKEAMLAEVTNVEAAITRDLAIIQRQEDAESALLEGARHRAIDLNMKEIEYHRLDRTRAENEKLYSLLLTRMKETDLARMVHANNLRVVETATVPGVPVRPRVALNVAVGLIAGFLIGFALAWLREQLDASIKTPNDIEQKLGITFLGLLPELDEGGKRRRSRRHRRPGPVTEPIGIPELIVHSRPSSGLAEAARTIRTNLMFMNPDRPSKTILVSSAAPSEGKTTVACSIAIALAQGGQRVCIVDCDLRRPRLHRIFDRPGDQGVTTVLVGDAAIEDVAKPTMVTNLWSIPTGPLPPNPADVLQSERFRDFIHELSGQFDRVVIDSPPLVAVTDSAIISRLVDGTVFVVRAFKTGKYLGAQGLRALRDVEAPIIGAVLNAVDLDHHEYAYHYYYYYKREGYRAAALTAQVDDVRSASPPN